MRKLYLSIISLTVSIICSAEQVSLKSTEFGKSGNADAIYNPSKSLAETLIDISFVIAAVPVVWHLAGNTPKAKKALIGYIAALLIYYGVIKTNI
jgi:hypothetical protein